MSFSVDTNILLFAANADCDEHTAAYSFLQRVVAEPETCYIPWPVLMSFLRIATHHRVFPKPLSFDAAWEKVEALLEVSHVLPISAGPGFARSFHQISKTVKPKGNLVPDAHIAAVLHEHGIVKLFSHDTDFRKFDFLEVIDPIA